MKTLFRFIFAASALFAAASCTQQLEGPATDEELIPMTITVGGEMTKTLVGEDGKTINWCEDDVIAIFDGVAKREFTAVSVDGKNATFTGSVAPGATELYAVYPYSAAVECVNGVVTASLPAEQQLDGDNVADGAIVAVGKVGANASVQFKNAVGFLRVDVSYDDVTEIIVNGSDIAGSALIAATGEVDKVADAASSVSLKPAGEKFAPGSYYVTLFPGVTSAGKFSVTLVRADKGLTMTAANEITVPRNAGFFVTDTKLSETAIIKDAASLKAFLADAAKYTEGQLATVIRDIDLAGQTLTPAASFKGVFNGNGHSLKNWTSNNSLFTTIAAGGTVSNIVLDESCVLSFPSDKQYFGFVVGNNAGTVSGVENYADVTIPALPTVANYYGTICGNNTATVADCANFGNITYNGGVPTQNACYGGIVGQITGAAAVARNLFNSGDVTATINGVAAKSVYWNGVLGWLGNNAKLLESINYGNVTVRAHGNSQMLTACGLVSYAGGEVSNCTNKGDITYIAETVEGAADGGVQRTGVCGIAGYMGWAGNTVTDNHNEGNIYMRAGYNLKYAQCGSALKYSTNVAGVFGHIFNCKTDNCSNSGNVTSILGNIENAATYYGTDVRQSCAGVIASTWGEVSNCTNSGTILAQWITKDRTSLAKDLIAQVGGIVGGDYNATGRNVTDIKNCVNSGDVTLDCDSKQSNNCVGGIAGYPTQENTATRVISDCENTGTITADGQSLTRIGGISGGAATVKNSLNSGKVYVKSGQATCTVGGIVAVATGTQPITNCESFGDVVSDIKLAGPQGDSKSSLGGIVGASFNQATITVTGCTAACNIIAPAGSTAFALVGVVGSNKNVTTNNVFGTADAPNVIKGGSIQLGDNKVDITSENYLTYALPWGTGAPVNANITHNTIWK